MNVTLRGSSSSAVHIDLLSSAGELIRSIPYFGQEMDIDTYNLQNGLYIVRLQNADETKIMKLIITR